MPEQKNDKSIIRLGVSGEIDESLQEKIDEVKRVKEARLQKLREQYAH